MNPFKNQIVNLSAGDAIKNKKDRHIYSAAKKQFEVKNFCKKQRNLRYYRNGKVRSVVNYEYGNDLARGNILCNNCDRPDNTCGDVFRQNAQRIDMHTNEFSEFNGGGVVAPDISWNDASLNFNYIGVKQEQSFTVINSDVSGSWDPSSNSFKGDISQCGPSGVVCPYGYVNNLIDIPKNLDGKGIIIDPSNELFPDSKCGTFDYLDNSYLKTNIIMRGTIDLSMNIGINTGIPFTSGDSCNDPSYNQFIGKFVQLVVDTGFNTFPPDFKPTVGVFYGVVKQICCLNPLVGPSGSIPWMDIHIELNNITNIGILNSLIKFKPQFKGPNWANNLLGAELGPYAWGPLKLPWALFFYDSTSITTISLNTVRSVTVQGYFSDINFYMGNCINNLTQTNSFRDTYMSCLEDGTKNINFTKHNPVNYHLTPPVLPPPPPLFSFSVGENPGGSTAFGFSLPDGYGLLNPSNATINSYGIKRIVYQQGPGFGPPGEPTILQENGQGPNGTYKVRVTLLGTLSQNAFSSITLTAPSGFNPSSFTFFTADAVFFGDTLTPNETDWYWNDPGYVDGSGPGQDTPLSLWWYTLNNLFLSLGVTIS